MKILASVKLSEHKYKTPEGYLVCQDAILARTGKQTYMKSELYPDCADDHSEIEIDRKAEQVFAPNTLASFEDKPITLDHPSENVNPENYNELSVGHARNIRKATVDGQEVMIGDLIFTSQEAIDAIENGDMLDLSCGYDCDITEGDNPEQINIRGNHIALCEEGRAGIARIIDSKPVSDVNPRKGERKKEFLSRFMSETAKEYPDEKQRYAVANSYWERAKDSISKDTYDIEIDWGFRVVTEHYPDKELADKRYDELVDVIKNHFFLNGIEVRKLYDSEPEKKSLGDSVSRGTFIQEFGKQGDQYKVQKIEGNVIFAEEVITKKLVLFKKDKENIDWATITKSEINDSAPSKLSMEIPKIKEALDAEGISYKDVKEEDNSLKIVLDKDYDKKKLVKILKEKYDFEIDDEKVFVYDVFLKDANYSRKFYVKRLNQLEEALKKLNKEVSLDENNREYDRMKEKAKEEIESQMEKYEKILEDFDE